MKPDSQPLPPVPAPAPAIRPQPTRAQVEAALTQLPAGCLPAWVADVLSGPLSDYMESTGAPPWVAEGLAMLAASIFYLGVVAEREHWDVDVRGVGPEDDARGSRVL